MIHLTSEQKAKYRQMSFEEIMTDVESRTGRIMKCDLVAASKAIMEAASL